MSTSQLVAAVLAVWNLVVLGVYGYDKSRARHHAWRVPERTLLWLAALGGGAGALLGMLLFRHKIRKPRFFLLVPLFVLAELYLAYRGGLIHGTFTP